MNSKEFLELHRNRELLSARFGGGSEEALVRAVATCMAKKGGYPFIVDTSSKDGPHFGDTTAIGMYLMYVLVAFLQAHKVYGERTESTSCTFYEVREALDKGIPVIAVFLGGDYPPKPPTLEAKATMARAFSSGCLYVDVRNQTDPDIIASAVMKQVLIYRKKKQDAKAWQYDSSSESADIGQPMEALSAAPRMQSAEQVFLVELSQTSDVERLLKAAADTVKANKDCVVAAVRKNGRALKYAADLLRMDKDVVLTALAQDVISLKWAMGNLNQDPDCLKAAGLWDDTDEDGVFKIVLSVPYSLGREWFPYASDFFRAMKRDEFLESMTKAYNPNAHPKGSCEHEACRGTLDTCRLPDAENLVVRADGSSKPDKCRSCWRFGFRWMLQECKDNMGIMIQVEDPDRGGLGPGQRMETVLASQVGTKVFRTYSEIGDWKFNRIEKISQAVKDWYDHGCSNMNPENVYIGHRHSPVKPRPRYERLG